MDLIVLLGPPGAGKGTVASHVAGPLGARHVSTGSILRKAAASDSPTGKNVRQYLEKGQLVPDSVMIGLIGELLAAADPASRFVLDGYPRSVSQAESLKRIARENSASVRCAYYIDVPVELAVSRLSGRRVCPSCGTNYNLDNMMPVKDGNRCDKCHTLLITRDDDRPETIRRRMEVYHDETAPLIAWYEKEGKLLRIDGIDGYKAVVKVILRVEGAAVSSSSSLQDQPLDIGAK